MNWTLDEYNLALVAYHQFGAVAQRARFRYFMHRPSVEVKLVLYALRDVERTGGLPTNPQDVQLLVQEYGRNSALGWGKRRRSEVAKSDPLNSS